MDKEPKTKFDPDLSPHNETNRQAARGHDLRFVAKKQAYVDEDGCLIRDRFGQPL